MIYPTTDLNTVKSLYRKQQLKQIINLLWQREKIKGAHPVPSLNQAIGCRQDVGYHKPTNSPVAMTLNHPPVPVLLQISSQLP